MTVSPTARQCVLVAGMEHRMEHNPHRIEVRCPPQSARRPALPPSPLRTAVSHSRVSLRTAMSHSAAAAQAFLASWIEAAAGGSPLPAWLAVGETVMLLHPLSL